jgi:hypothetical protein
MAAPGCEQKDKCAHCYRELYFDGKFIKGEFCIRFENWPKETIADICNRENVCTSFINREEAPDLYVSAILKRREVSPGVLDLNKFF